MKRGRKREGKRREERRGGGRQTGEADQAETEEEDAFNKVADAGSNGGLPVKQAL
ncbi:hypothetical protein ACQJ0S_26860 [Klebsiella pneumoniae]|uniref:hypothetical protein n=1 Tax=Klebsiella pneumoniae TaxID=573 RepID=UPI003D0641D6